VDKALRVWKYLTAESETYYRMKSFRKKVKSFLNNCSRKLRMINSIKQLNVNVRRVLL
jgi:hypothetical protein